MSDTAQRLGIIIEKTRILITRVNQLNQENLSLKQEIEELRNKLSENQSSPPIAPSQPEKDYTELKQQIDLYVKEIDDCLTQLES